LILEIFQQKIMRVAKAAALSSTKKTRDDAFAMPRRRRPSESKFSAENYARCKSVIASFNL